MRRAVVAMGLMAAMAIQAMAQETDLLNTATKQALESAKASLLKAEKVGPAIKRIGVATLDGDRTNATDLMKTVLVKTPFNVVLTSDADWGPLLNEFARQVKGKDVILKETAHKLRIQGVDAVLYGTVEKAAVDPVNDGTMTGRRATVRMLLNLASLAEANPGSLLWSEQITGSAEDLKPIPTIEKIVAFATLHRTGVTVAGAVVGALLLLILLSRIYRSATTAR